MSLFPSDTVKFPVSMNATIGLGTELCFHKATEFLMPETHVSEFQTSCKMVLSFCGMRNNQEGEPTIDN